MTQDPVVILDNQDTLNDPDLQVTSTQPTGLVHDDGA